MNMILPTTKVESILNSTCQP